AAGDRRQLSVVGHRCPYGHAVLQVLVGPDVNDLIEGPQLGVPERSQLGVLLPQRMPPGKTGFKLAYRSRPQSICTHFVKHRYLLWVICPVSVCIPFRVPHSSAKLLRRQSLFWGVGQITPTLVIILYGSSIVYKVL